MLLCPGVALEEGLICFLFSEAALPGDCDAPSESTLDVLCSVCAPSLLHFDHGRSYMWLRCQILHKDLFTSCCSILMTLWTSACRMFEAQIVIRKTPITAWSCSRFLSFHTEPPLIPAHFKNNFGAFTLKEIQSPLILSMFIRGHKHPRARGKLG